MSKLIEKTFKEWTKGLDPKEARITLFEKVRDIPYHVSFDKSPERPLKEGRGDCGSKHHLLEQFFKMQGLKTRHLVVRFDWKDTPGIPKEVLAILKDPPTTTSWHLALEVFIDGGWKVVDATWDRGLKKAGFPVVLEWDGVSSTSLAVGPLETHRTEDIKRFVAEKQAGKKQREKKEAQAFLNALNSWFKKLR